MWTSVRGSDLWSSVRQLSFLFASSTTSHWLASVRKDLEELHLQLR